MSSPASVQPLEPASPSDAPVILETSLAERPGPCPVPSVGESSAAIVAEAAR